MAYQQQPSQDNYQFNVIATVNSPYKEKFAIPRQPGLVTAAKGEIRLNSPHSADMTRGIEQFSHIWLLFVFHQHQQRGWKPLVRPPRLGGNKKLGVLATRSTFRPNPIGMSVVKLLNVTNENQQTILHISELDLLDGTPIIDIKPYLPYADNLVTATSNYAQQAPEAKVDVVFSAQALQVLNTLASSHPDLLLLIEQVLSQDPRPAYKQGTVEEKIYGMNLMDFNITWKIPTINRIIVISVAKI